ncbi:hypothetical protein, partial [Pseudomonas juntendi]
EFFGVTLTTHGTSYLGLIMRLGGVYETRGDSCISILEHISGRFALTPADYSNDMDRRLSAGYILSLTAVSDEFKSDHLYALAESKLGWLYKHCEESEFPFDDTESIDIEALIRMAETGAFPGESEERVQIRDTFYRELSEALKAEYEKLA